MSYRQNTGAMVLRGAPSVGVQLSLRSPRRAAAFFVVAAIPALLLIAQTVRIVLAESLAGSLQPDHVRQAIALDQGNAYFRALLGALELDAGSSQAAVKQLRRATELNPLSGPYWADLGKACYAAADQPCADAAFRRAVTLAPSNPQMAWDAAVNSVAADALPQALAYLRRFVALQPSGWMQAFDLLRASDAPDLAWRELLASETTGARLQFLEYLAARQQFDVALRYWTEMTGRREAMTAADANLFLWRLMNAGRYHDAAQVWNYIASTSQTSPSADSGFERTPSNFAFDWQARPLDYVVADFADASPHSGTHALRLDFTVPQNNDLEPVYRYVPVKPGHAYTLTAWVRTDGITSDSGPRLRVVDPACPTCLDLASDSTTGTTPWHEVRLDFTTGAQTEIVRLSIWRPRSRTYPMEISGHAWFDDINLTAESTTH